MFSRTSRPLVQQCIRRSRGISRFQPRRYASSENRVSPSSSEPTGPPPVNPIHDRFYSSASTSIDVLRRFFIFSAIGLVFVGATTFTALFATHVWVENVELAPETDEEVHKWQWDLEAERWSGPFGGTDPGLGLKGRMAVRSAWAAQHWGTGPGLGAMGSRTAVHGGKKSGDLDIVEARLEYAQDFLNIAINIAVKENTLGNVCPGTVTELIARHANIMERMGTRDALYEARAGYERVWAGLPSKGLDAARIALKLGDVNARLGDRVAALHWWARSLQLTTDQQPSDAQTTIPAIPPAPPSAPIAQRTLASTLVSLSAHYATTGDLKQAQAVEESSLNLLRSIPQPQSAESASPPQALHALYLLHRSSLISIHLAEVLYARKVKTADSVQWLYRAAESSERVAQSLVGRPIEHPDAPGSRIPHPPSTEAPLVSAYAQNRSMKRPATSLLRDARRTAAEAWSLMGILTERNGGSESIIKALEYYERALGWAGVSTDRAGGIGQAGEGTLEKEWTALWSNYVRVREAARKTRDT
ncbi:hypothetical protein CERSUDRAFT_153497 [Gelatoporia subvermispora B]|uniref:Uncharacterized protein n=1 Tax=Ceriporiopsis subvermispora (strain B) TaxID=914234 RepID=M2RIC5_CERS8|nr:hypothetical protein CERSUDRAFT_153497 [Gelatoporia subvermispora B]